VLSIVLDTNVLVAALRSKRGASFAVLRSVGFLWTPLISVPLILEYEEVGKRAAAELKLPLGVVDAIVRALCFYGVEAEAHFRVRPFLPDPGDEFILELAVAGRAHAIVTHNLRHFAGVERFGVQVQTPREFLRTIGLEYEQEYRGV
jgi:predicted nucleic acid-binding protein